MKFDLIIKNGKIVDGTGAPWFYGDIGINGDEIAKIGSLSGADATRVIDAKGEIVSPGFVDMHVHSDLYVFQTPELKPKLLQGITTECYGQDGVSAAPLVDANLKDWQANLSGLDGEPEEADWKWRSVDDYLTEISGAKPYMNVTYLVPHGNIRSCVMGYDDREATDDEIAQMQTILRRCLDEGAVGMSTGLIYTPCNFSNLKELEGLCQVLGEYGVPLVIHQRSEGDEILDSMDELIGIAKRAGNHLHVSHLKVCGSFNWYKTPKLLQKIDDARADGVEVTFDQYPYDGGSTMMSALLPNWVKDGGLEALFKRLADPTDRDRIAKEMKTALPGWDSFSKWAGWDKIIITSVSSEKNQPLVGKTMTEVGKMLGRTDYEYLCMDLVLEEKNAISMIDIVINDDDIKTIMAHPAGTIGSDALLVGTPHPRAYGTFPRVIGKYVREEHVLPLEQMIRRITSQAARILGISDRGILREHAKADITIFDFDHIIDRATFADPKQYPEGISAVIINGQQVVDHGTVLPNAASGKVLRATYQVK